MNNDDDDDVFYTARKRARSSVEHDDGDGASSSSSSKKEDPKKNPHLSESDIASRCFCRGNHIFFFAGVSKESVYRMHQHLLKINADFEELQRKNPAVSMTPSPIILHINSFGGGVFAAFAGIDFIRQSRIPVYTVVEGVSASAGTLMSIVGKRRYIRPQASMLIHQLSSWFGGKMTEIDDNYKNLQQMHDSIRQLYVEHTRISGDDLDELLKHDLWWKPEKCLEVGLVDAVWDGRDESFAQ